MLFLAHVQQQGEQADEGNACDKKQRLNESSSPSIADALMR
jgi:hypothetical protein